MVAHRITSGDGFDKDYPSDYLQYMYLLGVGQAIANHGRDIVGAENLAAKAQDTEGRERK